MAPTKLTDREPATVVGNPVPPLRASRLPPILRIPILVVLNLGINTALWSLVSNFLTPELGAVSKIPTADDLFSLYSPLARLAFRIATVWMTWYFQYDFLDVTALTVISQAPYAYLLTTFYNISHYTVAAHVHIEVASIAIPIYLLRPRSQKNNPNAPLRNRFLLNSFQVQLSNALLAIGIYVVVIWSSLKTSRLPLFLVSHFSIPTLEAAHAETPIAIIGKVFTSGFAAKNFLLNPAIAAQPASGSATPVKEFDPATATLPETVKANVWFFSKRTRTLIRQTVILNAFVFVNVVQRCMTLEGTEFTGAAGYASVWIFANTIVALWFGWVGDTSADV